jgi:NAD-dependent dihydropyrimidine dehydrogenase PreA subunit
MPRRTVVLNYRLCDPDQCQEGVCAAQVVCERKVLKQPEAYQLPEFRPGMCLGCADCVPVCPRKALVLM